MLTIKLRAVLLTATAISLHTSPSNAQSGDKQPPASPVVIELFTSQGCSSCPPADKLLTGLNEIAAKHDLPVYCLSFHVDYWNSLGWRDPYSSEQFTKRQRQYAAAFKSNRVYTPQMIVNGATEFVGSRARDAQQAIESGLAAQSSVTLELNTSLSTDGRNIEITYKVLGAQPQSLLNVALVQKHASNKIPRGENVGRDLAHVQVVRVFKTIALNSDSGSMQIDLPTELETNELRVIAYVQDSRSMQIRGATTTNLR